MTGSTGSTGRVRSPDGTRIALSTVGDGPPLVLVEPAGHYRDFSAFGGLVPRLTSEFTVVTYDRRGRGDSTDGGAYAVEREVEDLAAVIDEVGAAAAVHGASSGGLLAIQAVVHGLPIRRLSLLEPPLDDDRDAQAAFTAGLRARLEREGQDAALAFFLEAILPPPMVDGMRGGPEWEAMSSVADTLVHDSVLSEATDTSTLRDVRAPTLVLDSAGSSDDLTGMARAIARHIPGAEHRSLPGEWHGVDDEALAAALSAWFAGDGRSE